MANYTRTAAMPLEQINTDAVSVGLVAISSGPDLQRCSFSKKQNKKSQQHCCSLVNETQAEIEQNVHK